MSPLLLGTALGATSAFMLDPQQGPRRRAALRDKRALAGGAAVIYALARGGFGALVPFALGAALVACSFSASSRSKRRV